MVGKAARSTHIQGASRLVPFTLQLRWHRAYRLRGRALEFLCTTRTPTPTPPFRTLAYVSLGSGVKGV